jgi:hypothetical protein
VEIILIDNEPAFLPDPTVSSRKYLCEKLTYRQLFAYTDKGRKARAKNVRGPSLKLETGVDANFFHFNFRGMPSTTGRRHVGYVKFEKPKNPDTPLEDINCTVDCDCEDMTYRWAWSLKQRGAGLVGPGSYNKALNRAPRITNPRNKISLCKHIAAVKDYLAGLIYKQPDKLKAPERLGKLVTLTNRSIINPPVGGEAEPVIANSPYFRGSPIQQGTQTGPSRGRVEPLVRSATAMKRAEKERQDAVDRERRYGPIAARDKDLQADLDAESSRWSAASIKKKKAERDKRLAKNRAVEGPAKAAAAVRADDQSHKMKRGPSLADRQRSSTSESRSSVVSEMRLYEEAEALLAGADDPEIKDPVVEPTGEMPTEEVTGDSLGDESTKSLLGEIRDLLKDVLGVDAEGGGHTEPFELPDNAQEIDLATGEPKDGEDGDLGEVPSPDLVNNDGRVDVEAEERPDDLEDEKR